MRVSVILPTKGRYQQLAELLPRLKDTAQYEQVEYIIVADDDPQGGEVALQAWPQRPDEAPARIIVTDRRVGYWGACKLAQEVATGDLSIALANDLLPSRGWLARGVAGYIRRFGEEPGMLGANDGAQGVWVNQEGKTNIYLEFASHFLIHRTLLAHLGGWPHWYDHSHGDLELSVRARALGRFDINPWFVLFHNHWITGGKRDEVYTLGEERIKQDEQLYRQRRDAGWPNVSTTGIDGRLPTPPSNNGQHGGMHSAISGIGNTAQSH